MEPRLHGPDRDLDDLGDLGQMQPVQVMEHDDDLVLRAKCVDALQDDPPALGPLRRLARRFTLGGDVLGPVIQRAEADALPRPAVVRQIDCDAVQPWPQRVVRLETLDRAVGAREGVDDDLLRGGRVLRDRQAEAVDAVAVAVEQIVEREGLARPGRMDELAIAARLDRDAVALGASLAGQGRYRRIARSRDGSLSSRR